MYYMLSEFIFPLLVGILLALFEYWLNKRNKK
ncbi:type I toxin-antitoxin system Fst family toxin [Enterococcus faecalis]|nr:type I toxin-antitoxin system Fst family toxin [Enterococcus faecalis]EKC6645007.1 type I toxin-antitoxin system Fst family toxin [Enterococcus faecalis]EKC6780277.1 type I toxin-antitoxin system Fst family toxin [Enterococcus faecalis]EKC6801412.1 type I toxin-antitoxin system Fst family toxin [Enterococcus faecalis]EKZ0052002.1 type I toxin-antitoxin system Fst family toxin [Enterococcus faecalis]